MNKDKRRSVLSVFLLIVFLSYQAGISLFAHTHTINGFVVVHSHLYKGDNHIHTDAQIFAISHAAAFLGEEAKNNSDVNVVFNVVAKIGNEVKLLHLLAESVDGINFRAPPACC